MGLFVRVDDRICGNDDRNASPHLFTPHSDLCLRHIPISAAPTTPHDVIVREWGHRVQGARNSTNQSSPPGMQRAVGYKMHCSFVSPIPFNYAVQKGRRIVSERGVSATKTRQYHPESRTRVTISEAATQGYSTVAPPTDLNYSATT